MCTRALTHARTHSYTPTHIDESMQAHTDAHTHTHTRRPPKKLQKHMPPPNPPAHIHTRLHPYTHTRTHTHPSTHIHTERCIAVSRVTAALHGPAPYHKTLPPQVVPARGATWQGSSQRLGQLGKRVRARCWGWQTRGRAWGRSPGFVERAAAPPPGQAHGAEQRAGCGESMAGRRGTQTRDGARLEKRSQGADGAQAVRQQEQQYACKHACVICACA